MILRKWLSEVRDIERLIGRVVYGNSSARDLIALKKSLDVVPPVRDCLMEKIESELLKEIADGLASFSELENLAKMIEEAIVDEPPLSVREGGMIKAGYSAELDELRDIASNSKQWIAAFQQKEKERSGIKSLKVGYNKVFGYYIEVTNANSSQVPEDYIRKQTMVKCRALFHTRAQRKRKPDPDSQ